MIICIIVVTILLVIGTFQMPSWYYDLLRVAICIYCSGAACMLYEKGNRRIFIIYVSLAVLFNPFVKIVLDKTAWAIIDIITAFFFVVSASVYTYHIKKSGDENGKS